MSTSKRRKIELVDVTQFPEVLVPVRDINWELCILCQRVSPEPLIIPKEAGYKTLSENLIEFDNHEALPPTTRLDKISDGKELLHALIVNKAKYHKLCRNKYDSQKLQRIIERNQNVQDDSENAQRSARCMRSSCKAVDIKSCCLFCDGESVTGNPLVQASTKEIGPKVYALAIEMQDTNLLNKIANQDFIALEVKYHKDCYRGFLNRARSHERSFSNDEHNLYRLTYGSVIAELVSYMEEMFIYGTSSPVFKLSDINKLCADRMLSLGVQSESINRTRLKDDLISLVPGLREDKCGKEVILSFEPDVGNAIRDACNFNDMSDGICIAQAAGILRRDMFREFPKFSGSLIGDFGSRDCVPPSLVNFVNTLLGGYNIDNGSPASAPEQEAAYSIAQLIRFNSVKRSRANRPQQIRHQANQETPLAVYLGLMIHNCTRKRSVVDKLNSLGLSISYDRVQEIESSLTNEKCKFYEQIGHVIPSCLSEGVFTTAAIDNIDHNPSSTTSNDSFHGSSVTIIQHPDTPHSNSKSTSDGLLWSRKINSKLPDTYTTLPATNNVVSEPLMTTLNASPIASDPITIEQLTPWLNSVQESVYNTSTNKTSFAAFHAERNMHPATFPCHNILLPLLTDHIQSPATVRHLMDVIIKITSAVNNKQGAVITGDQPVYAVAKYIQWKFPDVYGEDKIVIMMGGLHIEMAIQNMIGKWLKGSGWTEMFIKAEVASIGRSESLLKSSHIKRTRYAHEVSLASLFILRDEAYKLDCKDFVESLEEWISRKSNESNQFLYWQTVMELESLLLSFVRSIRESNFEEYVRMLKQIAPWFFALDLTNYSRWLPVFIKTLEELPVRHPYVFEEFKKGHFTSRKTNADFSAMSDDQLHEQNNKLIKSDGGAINVLHNETALLKWMVAGPEISRMINEFENEVRSSTSLGYQHRRHHEDRNSFQTRYLHHVSDVVKSMRDDGNPFAEQLLQTADNHKIIMSNSAEKTVQEAKITGQQQYNEYVADRLVSRQKSIHEPLKRNKFELFHSLKIPGSNHKTKIADLKHDSNYFCKMYVASQNRVSDIEDFFSHENNRYPPSFSEFGRKRKATSKSDVLICLEQYGSEKQQDFNLDYKVSALIVDGAALVHMLHPRSSKTFSDYCENVIGPFVDRLLRSAQRLDIVFDRYVPKSLKSETREDRGSGQRINVTMGTLIPKKFDKFLSVDFNKTQLFGLISRFVLTQSVVGKVIVCTIEETACASQQDLDVSSISPCSAEEADGRLLLHANHALKNGNLTITIRTVDSDVVVIALSVFSQMIGVKELWIDFGVGKGRRMIGVHHLHQHIPDGVSSNLPFFHAFTGCDTVSTFCGIGKRTAWKAWMNYRVVDAAFHNLSTSDLKNDVLTDTAMKAIERFVVLMYDRSSTAAGVNECRCILYTIKNRAIENIPPTADALLQHTKRAALQAHLWKQCLSAVTPGYLPTEWGWKDTADESYTPLWCTLPEISRHCQELIRCSCKTECKNCSCKRHGLPCTKLCACNGYCYKETNGDSYEELEVEEDPEFDHVLQISFHDEL
ncbi:uncharacterized protein LOC136089121 [Hydra vulgaris]|uniref:Uncharacterized protein LOC136089121 n=1 Tax=Hydra vulgaris TaxID=6087 RepID=A0ABM4D9A3_HYDVU